MTDSLVRASILQVWVESLVRRLKQDPSYRIEGQYTNRQLSTALWHRGLQRLRGLSLPLRTHGVRGPVFRGRRVVVEHLYALTSGSNLILEDGATIIAISRDGIQLGRDVMIGRNAILTCTGVIARIGVGVTIGDRSAIGAGSFVGGQGGVTIGDDVIVGPGVRIFSENHRFEKLDLPIRRQGEDRAAVAVGDDCWIGAGATILAGVSIGTGCVIASGAVVTRDVAPWTVVAGVPARAIRSRQPAVSAPESHQSNSASSPVRSPTGVYTHQEDR